ncbi:hypothetical protein MPSEU_000074600 [Mayamaea pseudoterrestris]|nr:hypothetical protein MPSEU_000074600 [Mayamaea pseudoterrestris]
MLKLLQCRGCLLLAIAISLLVDVNAFLPLVHTTARSSLTTRPATIYYSPDEYCALDDCDEDDEEVDANESFTSPPPFLHSPNILGSLARLAVAFGPHKMALHQIEHVQVTKYDEAHVDLEVVLCEEECLTLLVPVAFPKPCQSTEEEECLIDNMHELDTQATAQIQQWEWDCDHHEEVSAKAREYDALKETDSYPDWWQTAGFLTRDCSSLQRLLNEPDFHSEIKALVAYNLATDSQYDFYEVDQVAVAAVGPAGLIVKASAHEVDVLANVKSRKDGENADDDDDDATLKQPKILQIPYAFPSPASDIDALQAAVLQAVAMAGDFMEG